MRRKKIIKKLGVFGMKFFKNTIAVVTLLSIGLMDAKQANSKTNAPREAIQPIVVKPVPNPTPTPAPINNVQTFKLDTLNYLSASVLPKYTHNKRDYVILTREARGNPQQQGGKLHTYDDFSGARDEGENDVLISAAREFHEEGILQGALGWNLDKTIKFVKDNTSYVIAYTKDQDINTPNNRGPISNVTYIVNFDAYATKLFNNFYTARDKERIRYEKLGKKPHYQVTMEKDMIASVLWDDLKNAIISQKNTNEPVRVQALVKDNKKDSFHKEEIVLRPFLPIKLRSFFLDQPYEKGENSKIRYYHQ